MATRSWYPHSASDADADSYSTEQVKKQNTPRARAANAQRAELKAKLAARASRRTPN